MKDQPVKKGPGGRPTKYKPEFCAKVVELASHGKGLATIARELGVMRETMWRWGNDKPEFCNALKRAYEAGLSWWEEQGRIATFGEVPGFNSTAYIFQMKNRFKDDWRDKHEIDQNVNGEITITIGKDTD
jgi:hypothetical protein